MTQGSWLRSVFHMTDLDPVSYLNSWIQYMIGHGGNLQETNGNLKPMGKCAGDDGQLSLPVPVLLFFRLPRMARRLALGDLMECGMVCERISSRLFRGFSRTGCFSHG